MSLYIYIYKYIYNVYLYSSRARSGVVLQCLTSIMKHTHTLPLKCVFTTHTRTQILSKTQAHKGKHSQILTHTDSHTRTHTHTHMHTHTHTHRQNWDWRMHLIPSLSSRDSVQRDWTIDLREVHYCFRQFQRAMRSSCSWLNVPVHFWVSAIFVDCKCAAKATFSKINSYVFPWKIWDPQNVFVARAFSKYQNESLWRPTQNCPGDRIS